MHDLKDAAILILDDEPSNITLLLRLLKHEGYTRVEGITDPTAFETVFSEFRPDLVLLDLMMPHMDGYEILKILGGAVASTTYLPILVLTADVAPEAKLRALSEGAHDFLTKPFDRIEVLLRIRNLLEARQLHLALDNQNRLLEEKVEERTRELEQARLEILYRLARAAEFRDDDTGQHTQRVGLTSMWLAREMGLPTDQVELIWRAAPLHDIGKIGIPDAILLKPDKLTPAEFEIMKSHSIIGARILSGSAVPVLRLAEEIALTHHERWDGKGYPHAIASERLPISGRIVAVADCYDALTHDRPYKKAWTNEEAVDEINRNSGVRFDPEAVNAFSRIVLKLR